MEWFEELDQLYVEYFGERKSESNKETLSEQDNESEDEICGNDFFNRKVTEYVTNLNTEDVISENEYNPTEWHNDNPDRNHLRTRYDQGCRKGCLKKFDFDMIEKHILQLKEMSKSEKEMLIFGTLKKANLKDDTRYGKRKRIRYSFVFHGTEICRDCFKYCFDVGEKAFRNLKAHLDENGSVPRVHGNTGRIPHNALKYEDTKRVVDFLNNYADDYGLPQPAAPRGRDQAPPIYLPCSDTKADIHDKYKAAATEGNIRIVAYSSFSNIWSQCCPHIRICSPKEVVCTTCEKLKQLISCSQSEEDKVKYSQELQQHIAICRSGRIIYQQWIMDSADELKYITRLPGPIKPLSTYFTKIHYTFDFSKHMTVPHRARQLGQLYFLQLRRIQMFGVRIDGVPLQYNYLVDENETLGKDGTATQGPNAVISMVHHTLTNYGYGEKECGMHADNCPGQNKNYYMLAYLCWRVMSGLHKQIKLMFQIPGHTRCLVDAGFAHIKRKYKRSDCDDITELGRVVTDSSPTNKAVLRLRENGEIEWLWRDWKSVFAEHFLPLRGIRKYHHFRFSHSDPGFVFVRGNNDQNETKLKLIKDDRSTLDVRSMELPPVIPAGGFSGDRRKYFSQHLCQFVRPQNRGKYISESDNLILNNSH